MGIENIHILIQDDDTERPNTRRSMSQHIVVEGKQKWVFGWDQPLMSFFLQVHDENFDEEENPVVWIGADQNTNMYEVDDLVKAAMVTGLQIDHETQVKLYGERDDGR